MAKQNIKDPGAHHNSSGALIRRFLPYLAKHKAVLFLDLFCAALTTLCDIFLPKIMSTITNSAMGVGITLTTGIVLKLAGIYFVLRIIDGAAQYFMSGIGHIMGVHIENTARHPSAIGVAVNVGCWSHRRGHIIFDKDLNYTIDTHSGVTL